MADGKDDVKSLVREYFHGLDMDLQVRLKQSRTLFDHSTIKGNNMEGELSRRLAELLGSGFNVGTGQVVDSHGMRTGQVDIVLHNGVDNPFRAGSDAALYFAEGVVGLCEVKSVIDPSALRGVLASGRVAKSLLPERTHNDVISWDVSLGRLARFYYHIPYVCFAYEARGASPEEMLDVLTSDNSAEWRSPVGGPSIAIPSVDALFVLGQGVYFNHAGVEGLLELSVANATDLRQPLNLRRGDWEYVPAVVPVAGRPPHTVLSILWALQVWLQIFSPRLIAHQNAVLRYYVGSHEHCDRRHPPIVSIDHRLNELVRVSAE